jgi:hypothetical protein
MHACCMAVLLHDVYMLDIDWNLTTAVLPEKSLTGREYVRWRQHV